MTEDGTDRIDRRSLLRLGVTGGALGLAGCNDSLPGFGDDGGSGTQTSEGQQTSTADRVSGTVTDVTGAPLAGASVVALGIWSTGSAREKEAIQTVGTATTGDGGVYAFDFDVDAQRERFEDAIPEEQLEKRYTVLATVDDGSGTQWYGSARYATDAFYDTDSNHEVIVDSEVVFGPAAVEDDEGNPRNSVTITRRVRPTRGGQRTCDPRPQTAGEEPAYPDQDLVVEVSSHPGPERSADVGRTQATLGSGTFSVQVPERDICVAYGENNGVRPAWTGTDVPKQLAGQMAQRVRRDGLGVPIRPAIGSDGFQPYTEEQQRNARKAIRERKEGMSDLVSLGITLLGLYPGAVGTATSLLSLASAWADSDAGSVEDPPMPSPEDPEFIGDNRTTFDPSTSDVVSRNLLVSSGAATGVALDVPLRFVTSEQSQFAARGNWSADGLNAYLDQGFTVDPTTVTPRGTR